MTTMRLDPLTDLIACPQCDTLYKNSALVPGAHARCKCCGVVLLTSRPEALVRILSLSIAAMILLIAAIAFPFLDLDVQGLHRGISVIDAALAFDTGLSLPLAVAVAFMIIVIPFMRLVALVYALGPLALGATPRPRAKDAFALAERLRPWAMAEIFMVGVAVALIKVAGLATVTLGPAFWALTGVVVITVLKDQLMCRYSIWNTLDQT